jgi:hypothetical protein
MEPMHISISPSALSTSSRRSSQLPSAQQSNSAGASKTRRQPISWASDGVNGGKSSIEILLEWMQEEHNLSRWWGSDNEVAPTTKEALCFEIMARFAESGIVGRNKADIRSKIHELQNIYAKAKYKFDLHMVAHGNNPEAAKTSKCH